MQLALLHAIGNPSKPLRHTVGTNVAVIVGVGGLPTWPELLSAIVACLESDDPDSLEGALDALYKVGYASTRFLMLDEPYHELHAGFASQVCWLDLHGSMKYAHAQVQWYAAASAI